MPDAEIEAMSAVAGALEHLEDAARGRVLRWAIERYSTPLPQARPQTTKRVSLGQVSMQGDADELDDDVTGDPPPYTDDIGAPVSTPESVVFGEFADLFDAAGPTKADDRALVAAYWLQKVQGQSDFQSFAVNRELKHLGHGDSKINRSFDRLVKRRPAPVLQTRKSGKTQQARKTYKLTAVGIKEVERMLTSGA